MEFWKAHGTANDFVVLRDLDDRFDLPEELVRALCDRRQGLGADGVLRLGAPRGDADVFMDYRNADGSIVEMCGNGVRVVAKHLADHGLIDRGRDTVVVGSRGGDKIVTLHRDDDGQVHRATVDMGPPILDPAEIPFDAWSPGADREEIDVDGTVLTISAVSMGNPHAVTVVDDVGSAPVRTIGPLLENHERFPKRTNVEFAQVIDTSRIHLRVWERGIGETASCGTGVCATAVVLQRLGLVHSDTEVTVPGGTLQVRYRPDDHPSVFLTGPAVEVAHGTLSEPWLVAARSGTIDPEVLR